MAARRIWTMKMIETAHRMRRLGFRAEQIAEAVGLLPSQVRSRFENELAINTRWKGGTRERVPDELLEDRERRLMAPRSLTASILGDPAPGYSALDRRV